MTEHNFNLLNCPFCGGKARLFSYVKSAQAECKKCGAIVWQAQDYSSKPKNKAVLDVMKKWNQRVTDVIVHKGGEYGQDFVCIRTCRFSKQTKRQRNTNKQTQYRRQKVR